MSDARLLRPVRSVQPQASLPNVSLLSIAITGAFCGIVVRSLIFGEQVWLYFLCNTCICEAEAECKGHARVSAVISPVLFPNPQTLGLTTPSKYPLTHRSRRPPQQFAAKWYRCAHRVAHRRIVSVVFYISLVRLRRGHSSFAFATTVPWTAPTVRHVLVRTSRA